MVTLYGSWGADDTRGQPGVAYGGNYDLEQNPACSLTHIYIRVKLFATPVVGSQSHSVALSRALSLRGQGTARHSSALRHCLGKAVALPGQEAALQLLLINQLSALPTVDLMVQTHEAGTCIGLLSVSVCWGGGS